MFGIGGWELLIIAVLGLLLFGPDKLPEIARTIGRFMRDFKRYQDLMESTIRAEIYSSDEPKKDPFAKGKEFREKVQAGTVPGAKGASEASDETESSEAETSESAEVVDSAASGPPEASEESVPAAEAGEEVDEQGA